jgi:ABC-type bacteriocin/lantibiotic exporter with double-glycine peptidase domain
MRITAPAVVLAAALAGGCATPPVIHVEVPFHQQEEGHCGEAALAMLLEYAGKPADPALLRRRLHLPAFNGTATDLMVKVARDLGLTARRTNSPDRLAASQSITAPMAALLGPFHEGRVGHFVVVTGFKSGRWVEVHSGRSPNQRMAWGKFMDRWAESEYESLVTTP